MPSYTLVHPDDEQRPATMPSPSSYEDEKKIVASAVQVAVKSSDDEPPPEEENNSTYGGDTMLPAGDQVIRHSSSAIGLICGRRRRRRQEARRPLKKRRKVDRAVDEQEREQKQQKEQEHEGGVVVQAASSFLPTENERQAAEALLLFSQRCIFPTPVAAAVDANGWCPKDGHLRVHEATKVGNQEARLTYTCKYCGKVFDNRHALGGHVSGHKHRQRSRQVGRIKRKPAPTVEGGVKKKGVDMAEAAAAAAVVAVAKETLRSWGRTRHRCRQRRSARTTAPDY